MTTLDRRDRRRATKLWMALYADDRYIPENIGMLAAALKREREETGLAAIGYLFGSARAKVQARRAFEANHGKAGTR